MKTIYFINLKKNLRQKIQCIPPLSIFFNNSKNNKDSLFIFLTFNKIELEIFCQNIKVIGLIWAFLRSFCNLTLKIPKWQSSILGVATERVKTSLQFFSNWFQYISKLTWGKMNCLFKINSWLLGFLGSTILSYKLFHSITKLNKTISLPPSFEKVLLLSL